MATWTTKRNPDGSARFEMVSSDIDKATRVDPTNDIIKAQHDELRKFSEANAARTAEAEQGHAAYVASRLMQQKEAEANAAGQGAKPNYNFDVTRDANGKVTNVSYIDEATRDSFERVDKYRDQANKSAAHANEYWDGVLAARDVANEQARKAIDDASKRRLDIETSYYSRDPSTYDYNTWIEGKYSYGQIGKNIDAAMESFHDNPERFLTDDYNNLSIPEKIAWNMTKQWSSDRAKNAESFSESVKKKKKEAREKEHQEWMDDFNPEKSWRRPLEEIWGGSRFSPGSTNEKSSGTVPVRLPDPNDTDYESVSSTGRDTTTRDRAESANRLIEDLKNQQKEERESATKSEAAKTADRIAATFGNADPYSASAVDDLFTM